MKKILVLGGGMGGLEAAMFEVLFNFDTYLWERGQRFCPKRCPDPNAAKF
jgi:pyruvate/2-oxoglutarate dehydrogenase complex dihydrolipoamide dehydrogenase (E3) component